jgi:NodT family efflux transporter outer membrane factor (OMF) lipoprotein
MDAPSALPAEPVTSCRRSAQTLVLASILSGLVACAPDLGPVPQPGAPQGYATTNSFAAPKRPWPNDQWWKAYRDPELDALIETALAGAPDMEIARARLNQAQAAVQQSSAVLLPTLGLDAQGGPTEITRNQGFPAQFQSFLPKGWHENGQIAGDADYELDLFGKNRAALAAATSDAQAALVDVAEARLTLSTSIAAAYADLLRLTVDQAAAQDAVRVRQQSAALVHQRLAQQLENAGVAAQADAQVGAAQADLDVINGSIVKTRDGIAALLGRGPDAGLAIPVPANPKLAPFGLPRDLAADLIGRRPDIVAARWRAEAAADQIKVAHADYYPNIDLSASYGVQSFDIKDIFTADSLMGHVGPAIHLPIFDGTIEGRYRASRARYDEAVATYDKTLSLALQQVADAIADERALAAERAHSQQSLGAAEEAYRIAKLRYRGGLSRYLDVLTAEDTLVIERQKVADLTAQAFAEDVTLVHALGGGFNKLTISASR